MWCLHPCNRERPLPSALSLPAFLAGKMKDEYGKDGWEEGAGLQLRPICWSADQHIGHAKKDPHVYPNQLVILKLMAGL